MGDKKAPFPVRIVGGTPLQGGLFPGQEGDLEMLHNGQRDPVLDVEDVALLPADLPGQELERDCPAQFRVLCFISSLGMINRSVIECLKSDPEGRPRFPVDLHLPVELPDQVGHDLESKPL